MAEQRRQRLKDLEQQMATLKKKMAEQSKIVKMKDSSDKQVSRLNVEIQVSTLILFGFPLTIFLFVFFF